MSAARDAGGIHAIAAISMRDSGGVLRSVTSAAIRDAGGISRAFFGSFSVAISPEQVFGAVNSNDPAAVQTQAATAAPAGGTAPYTYAWNRTDAALDVWSIASPTAASTRFWADAVSPGVDQVATFACTVTDANGISATTADVTALASNFNAGGGGPLP